MDLSQKNTTWSSVLQQSTNFFSPRSSLSATLIQATSLLKSHPAAPVDSPLFSSVNDLLDICLSLVNDSTIPEAVVSPLSEIVSSLHNLVTSLSQRLLGFDTWSRLSSSFILICRDVLRDISPLIHSFSSSSHSMFQAQQLRTIYEKVETHIWNVERADVQLYELLLFCKFSQKFPTSRYSPTQIGSFPQLPPLLANGTLNTIQNLASIIENNDADHITHKISDIVHQFGHSHSHGHIPNHGHEHGTDSHSTENTENTENPENTGETSHSHSNAHPHSHAHVHPHPHQHQYNQHDSSKPSPILSVVQFFQALIDYSKKFIKFRESVGFPSSNIISSDISYVITDVAACLRSQSRFSEALLFFDLALSFRSTVSTSSPIDISNSYNNCAICLHDQGLCSRAETLYRKSLEHLTNLHGASFKAAIARTMANLAHCLHDQGKCSEAKSFFHSALATRKQLFGNDHHETIRTLEDLGTCLLEQETYPEAEKYLSQVVTSRKKNLPSDHPILAHSLSLLANSLKNQGKHSETIPLLLDSLAIKRKYITGDHPEISDNLNSIGLEYHILGKFVDAVRFYKASLEMKKRMYPSVHLEIANSLNNLASAYCGLGKYDDAHHLYLQALDMREKLLPPNHHDIANSLSNLALCKHDLGHCNDAENLFQKALAIFMTKCASEAGNHNHNQEAHPDVAQCLYNIANCYFEKQNYAMAIPYYSKALVHFDTLFSQQSPETTNCKSNLAFATFNQLEHIAQSASPTDPPYDISELPYESKEEAIQMMREALQEMKQFNPNSLVTSHLYGNLAFCLRKSDPDQAKEYYNKAIDILRNNPSISEDDTTLVHFQNALSHIH